MRSSRESERKASADEIIRRLQRNLARIQGITLYMQAAQDITIGARLTQTQYQYTLTDADANELNHWSEVFLDKFRSLPEVTDVATDREDAGPMLDVTVNREVASSYGILPATIDNILDDAFGQRIVSTIYTSLNQYHVVIEVSPRYQYGPDALSRHLRELFERPAGAAEHASHQQRQAVASRGQSPGHVSVATISFNLKPGVALGSAVDAIHRAEQELGKPLSLAASFQGNARPSSHRCAASRY